MPLAVAVVGRVFRQIDILGRHFVRPARQARLHLRRFAAISLYVEGQFLEACEVGRSAHLPIGPIPAAAAAGRSLQRDTATTGCRCNAPLNDAKSVLAGGREIQPLPSAKPSPSRPSDRTIFARTQASRSAGKSQRMISPSLSGPLPLRSGQAKAHFPAASYVNPCDRRQRIAEQDHVA